MLTNIGEWGGNSQEGKRRWELLRARSALQRARAITLYHAHDSHLAEQSSIQSTPVPPLTIFSPSESFVNC